jgi:hypothetical protein
LDYYDSALNHPFYGDSALNRQDNLVHCHRNGARATGGLTTKFGNGAQVAVGAERAGIGGNFGLWTYRARASVPFGAQ